MRAVAGLTLLEMLRRRATIVLLVTTLIVVALSGWAFSALRHAYGPGGEALLNASEQLIFVMLIFSGILALTATFLSAAAVAPEIESGVALSLLARPLTRLRYVIGKWLGLATLITLFSLVTGGLEFLTVFWAVGYVPPHPVYALIALTWEALLLMTLALALSTRLSAITSAIIAMIAFFIAWMAGIAGALGQFLHNATLQQVSGLVRILLPTNGLWQAADYFLEPPSVISLLHSLGRIGVNPFVALAPQSSGFYVWTVLWLCIVLAIAVWSMRRREL